MPIIQCDIREGRSDGEKRQLAFAITDAVEATIQAPRDHIYVVIREQPAEHFVHAGEALPTLNADKEPRP